MNGEFIIGKCKQKTDTHINNSICGMRSSNIDSHIRQRPLNIRQNTIKMPKF